MGTTYVDVVQTRRIIPCRFLTLADSTLSTERPPLDDRGYHLPRTGDARRGAILSVGASHPRLSRSACEVQLERLAVGRRESLVAVLRGGLSFDEDGRVTERALPTRRRTRVRFFVPPYRHATAGSQDPIVAATIGVHLGSASGPRIGVLFVDVYEPLLVMLRPMCMLAHGPGKTPKPYVFRGATKSALEQLERDVSVMLSPAGVEITFYGAGNPPLHHLQVNRPPAFSAGIRAHRWRSHGLMASREHLLALRAAQDIRRGNSLPLVFSPQMRMVTPKGNGALYGLGVGRGVSAGRHLLSPGVLISDEIWSRPRYQVARVVAHEIGHVLGLLHPDNQTAFGYYDDAHTRRMMMYPSEITRGRRRHVDNVGYGRGQVGYLLTAKDTPAWRYANSGRRPRTEFVPEVRALRRQAIRGTTPTAAERRRELSPEALRRFPYPTLRPPTGRQRSPR